MADEKGVLKEVREKIALRVSTLKELFESAREGALRKRTKINDMNFFPVPDKDTGANLTETLSGIVRGINEKDYKTAESLIDELINKHLLGSGRGNVGLILTAYLIGFFEEILGDHLKKPLGAEKESVYLDAELLARAMEKGKARAYRAIKNPKEGTILDPITASSDEVVSLSRDNKDLIFLLEEGLKKAKIALAETPNKLPINKKHGVEDAGAYSWVLFLETVLTVLKNTAEGAEKADILTREDSKKDAAEVFASVEDLEYQFEARFIISGLNPERAEDFKSALSAVGDSLEMLSVKDKAHVHIHTNSVAEVRRISDGFGTIQEFNVEDMKAQLEAGKKKKIGLVIGRTADVPKEISDKHQMEIVDFPFIFPEEQDGVELKGSFYEKLKIAKKLPKTSQPDPGKYIAAYQAALDRFETIIVFTITSKESGTFSSANEAKLIFEAKTKDEGKIYVFDTESASVGEALLITRAQEMIDEGKDIKDIIKELEDLRKNTVVLAALGNMRFAEAGGRVSQIRFMRGIIGRVINGLAVAGVRPLIIIRHGKVTKTNIRIASGKGAMLLNQMKKECPDGRARVAIVYALDFEAAKKLEAKIEREMPEAEIVLISELSHVIGCHTGPNGLGLAFCPR